MPKYSSEASLEKFRMERFYRSISIANECWIWTKGKDKDGYGRGPVDGGKAHRYSFTRFVGEIPDGKCVLHRCDTPACVNPKHLFLGTNSDNMADRDAKGRQASRDRIRKTISVESAFLAAEDIDSGMSNKEVMEKYGVSCAMASNIKFRKTWHFRANP